MAETKKPAGSWLSGLWSWLTGLWSWLTGLWSWLTGLVLAIAAFLIWYYPYGVGSLPWQALAGAEIIACLSGISFAWFVVRLLGARKGEEQAGTKKEAGGAGTPDDDTKAKKPSQLFATRAVRVQEQLAVVKDISKTQRATVLAIRAAKAQAAQEAALARAGRRVKAARDLAQEADNIAAAVIKDLQKQVFPAADHAAQSAKEHFRQRQMEWTDEHEAQFNDILADVNPAKLEAWSSAEFVRAAKAKAEKTPMAADDSEAAAHTLAEAIAKALGGNAG